MMRMILIVKIAAGKQLLYQATMQLLRLQAGSNDPSFQVC
jgi:hypothetical protein